MDFQDLYQITRVFLILIKLNDRLKLSSYTLPCDQRLNARRFTNRKVSNKMRCKILFNL